MPKLPEALGTPQDLGAVPPDPSRIIPHYQAGQVGAAMQGFASDLGASANQIFDVQDRLNRAAAEQDFISKKLDLDQRFASDPDYSTACDDLAYRLDAEPILPNCGHHWIAVLNDEGR